MHHLGIAVYPEHATKKQNYEYMQMAASNGFTRLFTCLLSVEKSQKEVIAELSELVAQAHEFNFEVALDTDPNAFKTVGATPTDLSIFHKMGIDIIRLDGSFGTLLDRFVINNSYGIKIEFNASMDTELSQLIEHGANRQQMITCHNFYPERYSGLGWQIFKQFTQKFKGLGLQTAAFISSQAKETFGPWPVAAGLPTIEIHRNLPIDLQARHLIASELIDDLIIGNAFATKSELECLGSLELDKTMLGIILEPNITEAETSIIFDYSHFGRPDHSDYFIRSSIPKLKFKTTNLRPRTNKQPCFKRGDVVVVNDNLAHYRGELEVILQEIENDGQRNLVGHIPTAEGIILDEMELHPDHSFGFLLKTEDEI